MSDQPTPRRAIETGVDDAPATAATPRHAAAAGSPGRRALRAAAWIVGILVLVVGIMAAAALWRANQALNDIPRESTFMPTEESARPPVVEGPVAFVLIGSDNSDAEDRQDGQRSDSLMIAYVPENRQHIYLLSIPRDLWVPVRGLGYAKINAAYSEDGVAGTVGVVEQLFDKRIDHVGVVDFAGFIELMDVLGGVDVYNQVASEYWYEGESTPRYVFPEGMIHLEGDYGLAYVRQRHELPNGDLDRTERQRTVIKAIIGKALSKGVLTNPVVMNDFLGKVTGVVTVDSELDNNEIIGLATGLKVRSAEDVRTLMVPIGGFDTSDDGQSIDVPDPDIMAALSEALQHDTMDQYWLEHSEDPLITENREWPPGWAPGSGTTPEPTRPPTPTRRPGGPSTPPSRSSGPTFSPTREFTNPVETPTFEPS